MKIFRSEEGRNQIMDFYDRILDDYPVPYEDHMVQNKYGTTFVRSSGKASFPAIILLHGSGSNLAMWMEEASILSKNHYVISIDIIGECGRSDTSRPAFKDSNYSSWINEIFEYFQLNKATIVGCSLGAWIALDFVITYTEKLENLILLSPAGITPIKTSALFWIIVTSLFGKFGFGILMKKIYGPAKLDREVLDFAYLQKQYYIARTDILPVFSDEDLKKIKSPCLLIMGTDDYFYKSQKAEQRIRQSLKKTKIIIYPKVGHVLLRQGNIIKDFIKNSAK